MLKVLLSVFLGFAGGSFFFYHLYGDSIRAIKEKRGLNFWKRFLLFGVYATICAKMLKGSFLFFPLGFLISKITFLLWFLNLNIDEP